MVDRCWSCRGSVTAESGRTQLGSRAKDWGEAKSKQRIGAGNFRSTLRSIRLRIWVPARHSKPNTPGRACRFARSCSCNRVTAVCCSETLQEHRYAPAVLHVGNEHLGDSPQPNGRSQIMANRPSHVHWKFRRNRGRKSWRLSLHQSKRVEHAGSTA